MKKYKLYRLLAFTILSGLLLLVGNAFASGIWELDNNNYHIEGTWDRFGNAPYPYDPLHEDINTNNATGLIAKGPIPNNYQNTTKLSVDISYILNWVPDGLPRKNRPSKKVWLQEYGSAHWGFVGRSSPFPPDPTIDGYVTCGIGGIYSEQRDTYWALGNIITEDPLPWTMVDGRKGPIQRKVHFESGLSVIAQNNFGGTDSTAKLEIIENAHIRTKKNTAPYNTVSHTFNVRKTFLPEYGDGSGGGDPVDVATGQHAYFPGPDITVYNPYGPSVIFQRNYWSGLADNGDYSPGLACGWVHNYDIRIIAEDGAFSLRYSNGYEEDISMTSHSGPAGAPYYVTGVESTTPGQWDSITLTFTDQTQWVFTLAEGKTDLYLLKRIVNRMGRYITFEYKLITDIIGEEPTSHLWHVFADQDITTGNRTLLNLSDTTHIATINDIYGRGVGYTYGTDTLASVTTIGGLTGSTTDHWQYGYLIEYGEGDNLPPNPFYEPHLNNIKFLSPHGGYSEQKLNYQDYPKYAMGGGVSYYLMDPRVHDFTDANDNKTEFVYPTDSSNSTVVNVYKPINNHTGYQQVFTKRVNYETGADGGYRMTGETDANNHSITATYYDTDCPYKPDSITDKNNKTTNFNYDIYGRMLSVTRPRSTITAYTYTGSTFPTRLTSIHEGNKLVATIAYYEPSGLVNTITSPSPTGTGNVTTTYTYDALGNRLTATYPDASGNSVTITYNYTTDGTYTQPAKIGQPLTITDNLGRTTHYRYDDRGNVTSAKDDAGNETNITYNAADQPLTMILPPEVRQ